jgi:hypothetical protein
LGKVGFCATLEPSAQALAEDVGEARTPDGRLAARAGRHVSGWSGAWSKR